MKSAPALAVITVTCLIVWGSVSFAGEWPDNVYTAGVDLGYAQTSGHIGKNFSGGPALSAFFGFGITEYFCVKLELLGIYHLSTSEYMEEIADYGAFAGLSVGGRLYPRGVFRDSEHKLVQPYIDTSLAGAGLLTWFYNIDYIDENNVTSDSVLVYYAMIGAGCDFFITNWLSVGLTLKYYFNQYGTIDTGDDFVDEIVDDFSGNTIMGGLRVYFKW